MYQQILNMINSGIVVLDREFRVCYWNRWMAIHSAVEAETIVGRPLFELYPMIEKPSFLRICKSVFTFGNYAFLSQKLHKYLFPFKLMYPSLADFDYMQQRCSIGALRNDAGAIDRIFITVEDVTEVVSYGAILHERSIKDFLTGLYNRRYLDARLSEEMKRHRRYDRPLSLIMFDIDYFKKVNDRFGHHSGDVVLKGVSSTGRSVLREMDVMARYGGEEFCSIVVETPIEGASIVAERLRERIANTSHNVEGNQLTVTVSLGVTELDENMEHPAELIVKADSALYEAKQGGRNRAVVKK